VNRGREVAGRSVEAWRTKAKWLGILVAVVVTAVLAIVLVAVVFGRP